MSKRQKILTTAEALLAERGLYGLSMKLLADNAGIAAGTIYRYFENKETLINELYLQITQEGAQAFFNGWSEKQDPEQKYKLLWRNVFDTVLENPQRLRVIEMLFSQPDLAQEHVPLCENSAFAPLFDFYQQGIDEGRFHHWQIPMLITLSFDSAITLAKKITRKLLVIDETQINQVRDASWLIIQKNFNTDN
ncbi:MAG: TetR/AcrR family transcriptional regulator [Psychromonas sp.]|nr:TetR/AcrR family transcriptional regulator [Psychromonas sp.]